MRVYRKDHYNQGIPALRPSHSPEASSSVATQMDLRRHNSSIPQMRGSIFKFAADTRLQNELIQPYHIFYGVKLVLPILHVQERTHTVSLREVMESDNHMHRVGWRKRRFTADSAVSR
jgi:hypothetical protein